MGNFQSLFTEACKYCADLNIVWMFWVYAAVIALLAVFDRKIQTATTETHIFPDLGAIEIPQKSVPALLLEQITYRLNLEVYVHFFRKIVDGIVKITRFKKRGVACNIFVMFVFYYMIVTPFAGIMVPINYSVTYDFNSVLAMLLMILTNAVGDVVSILITLNSFSLIYKRFNDQGAKPYEKETFIDNVKEEFFLYAITLRDGLLAALVLAAVLILSSVCFGASIGEYDIGLSKSFFSGAWDRIMVFWDTAWEPYWFKESSATSLGVPGLLIYSISSFVPTFLIVAMALVWTIFLPVRVMLLSQKSTVLKLIFSESCIFGMCTATAFSVRLLQSVKIF